LPPNVFGPVDDDDPPKGALEGAVGAPKDALEGEARVPKGVGDEAVGPPNGLGDGAPNGDGLLDPNGVELVDPKGCAAGVLPPPNAFAVVEDEAPKALLVGPAGTGAGLVPKENPDIMPPAPAAATPPPKGEDFNGVEDALEKGDEVCSGESAVAANPC
jgi:hypothetical protein